MVHADGTAGASWARSLRQPAALLRDLADAVHTMCALHATAPGIVDTARAANPFASIQTALDAAATAFDGERAALVALTAAVGPLPSTPGQAECETTVMAQRHALAMLLRSDRAGCATGATIAFLLDWHAIRTVLSLAASRVGMTIPEKAMPDAVAVAGMLADLAPTPAIERAMAFGAQQLLAQHRGLWHLLEARASARRDR